MDQKELEIEALQRTNFDEMNGEIPVGHTQSEMPISREKMDEIAEQQNEKQAGTNPVRNGMVVEN
jgi:hypothetical protein